MRSFLLVAAVVLFVGCLPSEGEEPSVSSEMSNLSTVGGDFSKLLEEQPGPVTQGTGSEWFCSGGSYHTNLGDGTIIWTFYTTNDSTRNKRQAPVTGRVFHPNGTFLSCNMGEYNSGNTCTIATGSTAGFTSAVGEHFCCEKRSFSYVCTNVFYTSDAL